MKSRQSGLTLIEIAIVLVVIGLLLGGVLKGQELINSAKVKNVANDFRSVANFVLAYQDKFRALPGDDRAAVGHVAAAVNGNGDGRIDGAWNDEPDAGGCGASESCNFWQHVRLANLASGTTVFNADYLPRNAEGGRYGVTGVSPVKDWGGSYFVCSSGLRGSLARQLDITLDDGNTATGNVRVICEGVCPKAADAGPPANLTPGEDAKVYTVCASS